MKKLFELSSEVTEITQGDPMTAASVREMPLMTINSYRHVMFTNNLRQDLKRREVIQLS